MSVTNVQLAIKKRNQMFSLSRADYDGRMCLYLKKTHMYIKILKYK